VSPNPTNDFSALAPLADELVTMLARVASDIALVIDHDGVIRSVATDQAALAAPSGEWIGRRWVDTVTSDTQGKIELLLDEVRSAGATRRREVNHPGDQGHSIPVTWSAVRLGKSGQILAVGRDMRAVAAIQQRLVDSQREIERDYWRRRQNESRHRLLFQVARDAVLVLDADNLKVLESNAAATAVLGVDAGSLGQRPLPDLVPAMARGAVTDLLTNARSTGRAGEIRLRLGAGGAAVDLAATPFRVGDAQRMLLRAHHEEPGDDALAAMADFVDSTADAAVIVDSAGRVLMANAAMLAMVHRSDESQLKGIVLPDLVGDSLGAWAAVLQRARSTGIVPQAQLAIVAAGLAPLPVQVMATLMPEGDQECIGLLVRPRYAARVGAPSADALLQQLTALGSRMGQMSLAEMLLQAQSLTEAYLVHAALQRAGGSLAAAAASLALTPEALMLLAHRLGLSQTGGSASDPPPSIN
jgi:transcriptional regulator PpsR